ncbi:MAG: hypothetical protein ACRDRO_28605 [Pseudonocardiaceae bacterium]
MTTPGPHDPTIAYLVHRGALITITITITITISYLVFRGAPDVQEWVISAIQAVRGEWSSWH